MTELAALAMVYQAELIRHAVDAEDALDRLRITFGAGAAAAALERSQTSMLSLRETALAEFEVRHRADRERRWAETVRRLRAVTAVPVGIQDRAGSPRSADDA